MTDSFLSRMTAGTRINKVGLGVAVSSAALAPYGQVAWAQGLPSWTGFYVGGQFGLAASPVHSSQNYLFDTGYGGGLSGFGSNSNSLSQGALGAYFGYNQQFGKFLAGLEGDINARFGSANSILPLYSLGKANGLGGGSLAGYARFKVGSNWEGSLRARLGFLATERILLFGTAGVSWADFRFSSSGFPGAPAIGPIWDSLGGTRSGFVFGGGFEYALSQFWHVKLEALHAIYDHHTANFTSTNGEETYLVHTKLNTTTVRIGMSRQF
jgi:outer membrane immunogenic protein